MKQSLSFLKMKLTNNTLDQHGHVRAHPVRQRRAHPGYKAHGVFDSLHQIILHSMHRYRPRFHVIQADSRFTVRWGPSQSFSFPETTFTAVTAYQNPKVPSLTQPVTSAEQTFMFFVRGSSDHQTEDRPQPLRQRIPGGGHPLAR